MYFVLLVYEFMSKKLILLVEDNADDELLTIHALNKSKVAVDVTVVRDGAEALDYLFCEGHYHTRNHRLLPDMVLLDLKLPKVDGIGVLKQIKRNEATATLPVIVLTTSSEQSDIASSYKLGANSYIRKPVDFEEFTHAISRIGEYWLSLNLQVQLQ